MHNSRRPPAAVPSFENQGVRDEVPDDAAAARDAAAIMAQIEADEAAADFAREAYHGRPMEPLAPDTRVAPVLAPGEHVLAVRRSVSAERRVRAAGPDSASGLGGDLYVTSRRILLVGRVPLSIDLDEIDETVLAGEQCLLVTRDGRGIVLDTDQPRLLRVEIAAARRADSVYTHKQG